MTGHDRYEANYVAFDEVAGWPTTASCSVGHITPCATEDLKAVPFQPEFAGKMNFYLSAVNNLLRHPDDQPSIGLILCKTKNQVVAEYALEDYSKPIGISEYRFAESLPEKLQGSLPTIEELESELGSAAEEPL
jgi:hypothetical protein